MNYKVIAKSGLYIRSEPKRDSEDIGTLAFEQIVESPDWIPIILEDDTLGWASREFLVETQEGEVEVPIVKVKSLTEPLYQRDLTSKFGLPKDGASYLKIISLREFSSFLTHVKDFEGNPWGQQIYGHKVLEQPLKVAFKNLCDRGCVTELKTYDGCFNIRRMTGGGSYSVHSWGLAVDFNAAQNPFGGPVQFTNEFILCFADAGFESGALWNTPDGMHFQLPWTRDWNEVKNPLGPKL